MEGTLMNFTERGDVVGQFSFDALFGVMSLVTAFLGQDCGSAKNVIGSVVFMAAFWDSFCIQRLRSFRGFACRERVSVSVL